jgi:hypothetical protein
MIEASADPFRYRSGLRNSPGNRMLNAKQIGAVIKSLRDKTGFLEMGFDEAGFLTLGDRTKFTGGSATARALLSAAVDVRHAIDLEEHSRSPKVAFARTAMPVVYCQFSSGKRIEVYPLEIDFSDLLYLRGDRDAIAAFDLGFIILHELGHAALGLRDYSSNGEGPGECEEFINRIRREMNLPERQTYIARTYSAPTTSITLSRSREAELVFARTIEKQGRTKQERLNLRWEALKVGPITHVPTQSMARIRSTKAITATVAGQ